MGLPNPERESNRGSLGSADDLGLRGLRSDAFLRAHRRRRRRRLTRRRAVAVSVERASSSTARPRQRFGRFHPRPAALALNWQPTTNEFFIFPSHGSPGLRHLYRRPRSRKAKIHYRNESAAGLISNHRALPTRRADLTLRAHERACRTPGGMRPSLLPLILFSFREMNMMSPGLIPHLAN
jgi:hypothetical protein